MIIKCSSVSRDWQCSWQSVIDPYFPSASSSIYVFILSFILRIMHINIFTYMCDIIEIKAEIDMREYFLHSFIFFLNKKFNITLQVHVACKARWFARAWAWEMIFGMINRFYCLTDWEFLYVETWIWMIYVS